MRNVLLLGSGFSKNFGGFLPDEIFLKIFNHNDCHENIRNYLLRYRDKYDFEKFYEDFINESSFTQSDINIVKTILVSIYRDMDNIHSSKMSNFTSNFSYLGVIRFLIDKFSYAKGGAGYIFSLNQDLLVERLVEQYLGLKGFYKPGGWGGESIGLLLPHYGPLNAPFHKYHKSYQFSDENSLLLGNQISQESIDLWDEKNCKVYESDDRFEPCIVKLHGSYYLESNNGKLWIIGGNKLEKINESPLLKYYFKKFHTIMKKRNNIYVIGYGFNDEHINDVLFQSCRLLGSRLVVVDAIDFNQWTSNIEEKVDDFQISWLSKYYNSFADLFPSYPGEASLLFGGDLNLSRRLISEAECLIGQ